jgi:hypothetical protein
MNATDFPKLDLASPESLRAQISRIITDLAARQILQPGELLSARALARHWGVDRKTTVMEAFRQLCQDGVLDNQVGRGHVVRDVSVGLVALLAVTGPDGQQQTVAVPFTDAEAAQRWTADVVSDHVAVTGYASLLPPGLAVQQLLAGLASLE